MKTGGAISIWFFIGISLWINGLLILAAGLYEMSHPPEIKVVLYHLHSNVWWGALLFLCGLAFCFRSVPWRTSKG
ncbi:MAG: hypothetical protein M3N22_01625 [Acidobacteriota bacterium]|nr:hypothetical protein [Acidobacteriota bacterium]